MAASGATSYQWQVNTGAGFTNIANTNPYSGVTGTTLTISNVAGLDGYQYRCVATGDGGTTNSGSATLTVNPLPAAAILTPTSTTLTCATTSISLTATGGSSYRWDNNTTNAIRSVSANGTYLVIVTGANNCTTVANTTIFSNTVVVSVTNPLITTAVTGSAFNQTFTTSNGASPLSFSVANGSLPAGLNLATTGVLSGTPNQAGSFPITVRATDANGCSGVSAAYSLLVSTTATVSTAAPSGILATSATLGGNITSDGGTPVQERGIVYMTGNGTPTTSNFKVAMGSGVGNFSQIVGSLTSGTAYSVRAYAINAAGTSYGNLQSFTTVSAPSAPVVISPANGSTLSNNRPPYVGSATPVSSVTVFVDDSNIGEINTDANGNWSYTPATPLSDGQHRVYARASLNNLSSPNSTTNTFSIDTTAPASPIVTNPANGTTTNDNTPTYAGTAEPLSTVRVLVNGSSVGTATADASGGWNLTPSVSQADGRYVVRATATDPVGNTGPGSTTIAYTIDTTRPQVSLTSNASNPTSTGPIPVTITFSESVSGFVNGSITVKNGTLSDFAGNGSMYTVTITPGATGTVSVSVAPGIAQDLAGNSNLASNLLSIQYAPALTLSDFTASPDPVCVGKRVTFTANLGNLTGSYAYTLTNGTSITSGVGSSSSFSQSINTITSGVQTFTLLVSNNGQKVSGTYDLSVSSLPQPTLAVSNDGVLNCTITSLTLTVTDGDDYVFSGPGILSQDPENGIAVINASGLYSVTVTNTETGCFSTTTTTVTSNTALPSLSFVPGSTTLTCINPSLILTANGEGSLRWSTGEVSSTISVTQAGPYSVTLTGSNGCSASATTSITSNTVLSLSTGATLPQANVGVVVSVTASGAISYQWTAPATVLLTTPTTGSAVSASLITAGVQTFTLVATAGVCSQSALVSVTALAGPDLSAILNLPNGNFTAGEHKGVLVQLQEVNGAATNGSIQITITVPTGYSVSFDNTISSIEVSGGGTVNVQNTRWHQTSGVNSQQLSLVINAGEVIGARTTVNLGFTLTRTSANTGSFSNITVNVADDGSGSYDVNRLNNIYARIINGI